jgi:acyl-CoA dehydrogenase
MDFDENPGHSQIRQTVQRMMQDFPDEYWMECDQEHRFPWDFYNAFATAGLLGVMMPEDYGGSGLGLAEASLVLEEVATSGAAMAGASSVHLTLWCCPIWPST